MIVHSETEMEQTKQSRADEGAEKPKASGVRAPKNGVRCTTFFGKRALIASGNWSALTEAAAETAVERAEVLSEKSKRAEWSLR